MALTLLFTWAFAAYVVAAPATQTSNHHETGRHPGVANQYIIQYHEDHNPIERLQHEIFVHSTTTRYSAYSGIIRTFSIGNFQGYHAHLSDDVASGLASGSASHLIKGVFPDGIVTVSSPTTFARHQRRATGSTIAPAVDRNTTFGNIRTQQSATWGQARISHRRPNATSYTYDDGSPTVYHIDTGIQLSHHEFAGKDSYGQPRVRWGQNFIPGSSDTDDDGHGTHTAGTIGGVTYGVAPRTRILAAKVFDGQGQGSWSGVIAALDWACADAVGRNATGLSIINMSLGGGNYPPVNDAVAAVARAGMSIFVSAGNSGADVKDCSPANSPYVITVGATDDADNRADFSNWGAGLDLFAPGVGVLSAGLGPSNEETAIMSGTSQAAPHVAGVAAYLMMQYGWHTPAQMRKRLKNLASKDVVVNPGDGSPNLIVFNGNSAFA
ncbi:subtilisin-like protein [Thozetella sp. PMI_491]|nr:subtilisin-like protein [Thozetella sp. PMI_491]